MMYWRMQMHPDQSGEAIRHCVDSLAAGFIGLDFETDVGDLTRAQKSRLPVKQKHYWAFAHEMKPGDRVLIIAHQFPFALATISSDYNYVRQIEPKLGVWFRHFRHVDEVRYYADFVTDVRKWQQYTMTGTISPLRTVTSDSYQLIESWTKTKSA